MMAWGLSLPAQQLVDDLDRPNSNTVGAPWTEVETASPTSIMVKEGMLRMSSATQGRDYVSTNTSGIYNTPLSGNACRQTWMFNMRQSRPDPGGFQSPGYGIAFVLAGSSSNLGSGQGYAVVLGNPTTSGADLLRLVRYSSGLYSDASLTNIITSSATITNEFLAVKVTYDPGTNTWNLYYATSPIAFIHPALATTLAGTATNATYTGTNLPYSGCLWNHSTTGNESALFDNIFLPSPCGSLPKATALVPTVGLPESYGTYNVQFLITPPPTSSQTLTVGLALTNAAYGLDLTTLPDGSGGTMNVTVPAGTMVLDLPLTIIDDAIVEPATETALFAATNLTGGTIGASASTTLVTIGDNDQAGTVLSTGDILVVGVNSENSAFCTATADDRISFICFKDITAGTTIDLTDNAYTTACAGPGPWSDTEGVVRMTRTGPTIPAGTVITWRLVNQSGANNVTGIGPDAHWNCMAWGPTTFPSNIVNLAAAPSGDQFFFLQQGNWNDPNPTSASYNATYSGIVIGGFTTNGAWAPAVCNANNSGLPPDLLCVPLVSFSGNYIKYSGDILTPRTRSQWTSMLANAANWTSYTHCSDYNGTGNPWEDAPVLPILPGTGTSGRWTGAVSTDWFDCRNWEDFVVPTVSTDVLINQVYAPDCIVSISTVSASTAAVCNTLTIRSNGIAKLLTVDQGRSLTVTGATLVERLNAGAACGITVQNASTFTTGSLTLRGATSGSPEAFFSNTAAGNTVTVNGHLRIDDGGRLGLTGGTLRVNGDFTNLNSEARFEDLGSTVIFGGSGAQSISTSGFEEYFHVLRISKPAGDLTLNNGIRIRNNLDLLTGRVLGNGNLLVMDATATATGASDASFVSGAVQKYGTADFTFPVGKGTKYRRAGLNTIIGSATDAFTCEYFATDPQVAFGPWHEPSLHHVSACEYWMISRSVGSANAYVSLSWDTPASCGVTLMDDLRIARWDGSTWLDRGQGERETGSTTISGSMLTSAQQTLFSPWTLASVTVQNPLPIQLIAFTARPEGTRVRLAWTTATEQDNAFFTVERGTDAIAFTGILEQEGAGTSQAMLHYEDVDNAPLPGLSYYRLRQTDIDGTSTVSDAVPVYFGGATGEPLIVLYAADGLYAMHGFSTGSLLEVMDMTGRVLRQARITASGLSALPVDGLTPGAYVVRLSDGVRAQSTRFVR